MIYIYIYIYIYIRKRGRKQREKEELFFIVGGDSSFGEKHLLESKEVRRGVIHYSAAA